MNKIKMEKLKQLGSGNYYNNNNKLNLSPSPKVKHKQQQQQHGNGNGTTIKQTQQQQQPKIDIDFLHKIIFDINSKLDSNIYWLTTLLQNIILSIETLNKKTLNLDKRLSSIENLKNTTNININSRRTSVAKFNDIIDEDPINFTINTTSTANNSINNSSSLNNSGDTIIDNIEMMNNNKKNVLLRRRTTIQVTNNNNSNENVTFRRKNRLSQPTIEQNRRFSYTPTTIKITKSPNSRRISTTSTCSSNNGGSGGGGKQQQQQKKVVEAIESSNSNSATSIKQQQQQQQLVSSTTTNSSFIENIENLKSVESKRPTDTDQESLDNFIDLPPEEQETEESKLSIKNTTSSNQSTSSQSSSATTNEIVKLRNIKKSNSKMDKINTSGSSSNSNSYAAAATAVASSTGRIIKRFKILKDGPFEFVLDIIDNELCVMEIFEGGIIQRHGGIKVGDILLAANGMKLSGKTFNEAQVRLETAMEDDQEHIELIIARNPEQDDEEITAL